MKKPLVIGISGGSGSGKTTWSQYLLEHFSHYKVRIIHSDRYFKKLRPVTRAPFSNKDYDDFNQPESVDVERLISDMDTTISDHECDLLIVEGFLIFHFEVVRERLTYKFYIDCESDERLVRRIARDSKDGHNMNEIVAEYLDLVRHSHDKYVEPTKWYADLIINGTSSENKGRQMIVDWIQQELTFRESRF
ncbi:uridine kinase family protein [Paenibacillus alginolyticus]|uniref:AAA family ATPase n=1 Tax=Paenibacillus alginolyticus TaxID=59839 RepID=A0ABT4GBU8_9BACL|nr:AAA family ATPase [Paenibacillus alginolyticus]MCY9693667.1 AAA family ATPase [Paenibacillus alginolyticus]MEC0145604.1 AAA family ATPase [Paenibacillus alginolyticus]